MASCMPVNVNGPLHLKCTSAANHKSSSSHTHKTPILFTHSISHHQYFFEKMILYVLHVMMKNDDDAAFCFPVKMRRRSASDEFFVEGNITCELLSQWSVLVDLTEGPFVAEKDEEGSLECVEKSCPARFSSTMDLEDHVRLHHFHSCKTCKASFPSNFLLDLHIKESHDTYFHLLAKKRPPQYSCLVESCGRKFDTKFHRNRHLTQTHNFPKTYRFDKSRTLKKRKSHNRQRQCKFYGKDDGCKFGAKCKFAHDGVVDSEEDAMMADLEKSVTNLAVSSVPERVSFGKKRSVRLVWDAKKR